MPGKTGRYHISKVSEKLEKMKEAPRKVIERTVADAKKRVPGWVAAEVAEQYGIKKKEVGDGKTSKIKVEGKGWNDLRLKYSGRVLTPTHFQMSPTAPKPGGGYTLKATIIKGQRSTLGKVKKLSKKQRAALGDNFKKKGTQSSDHSPIMLMHTGAKSGDKTQFIPFQRKSTNRKDIQAIKTVSVPQMISNERVRPNIQQAIDEKLGKRIEHHMKLLEK